MPLKRIFLDLLMKKKYKDEENTADSTQGTSEASIPNSEQYENDEEWHNSHDYYEKMPRGSIYGNIYDCQMVFDNKYNLPTKMYNADYREYDKYENKRRVSEVESEVPLKAKRVCAMYKTKSGLKVAWKTKCKKSGGDVSSDCNCSNCRAVHLIQESLRRSARKGCTLLKKSSYHSAKSEKYITKLEEKLNNLQSQVQRLEITKGFDLDIELDSKETQYSEVFSKNSAETLRIYPPDEEVKEKLTSHQRAKLSPPPAIHPTWQYRRRDDISNDVNQQIINSQKKFENIYQENINGLKQDQLGAYIINSIFKQKHPRTIPRRKVQNTIQEQSLSIKVNVKNDNKSQDKSKLLVVSPVHQINIFEEKKIDRQNEEIQPLIENKIKTSTKSKMLKLSKVTINNFIGPEDTISKNTSKENLKYEPKSKPNITYSVEKEVQKQTDQVQSQISKELQEKTINDLKIAKIEEKEKIKNIFLSDALRKSYSLLQETNSPDISNNGRKKSSEQTKVTNYLSKICLPILSNSTINSPDMKMKKDESHSSQESSIYKSKPSKIPILRMKQKKNKFLSKFHSGNGKLNDESMQSSDPNNPNLTEKIYFLFKHMINGQDTPTVCSSNLNSVQSSNYTLAEKANVNGGDATEIEDSTSADIEIDGNLDKFLLLLEKLNGNKANGKNNTIVDSLKKLDECNEKLEWLASRL